MSGRDNPYARTDPLGEFMRGWNSVEQIRRQGEDRKEREENREYTRSRRAREVTLDGRQDTTWDQAQGEYKANAPLRDATRAGNMAVALDAPEKVAYEQRGRMSPEQQERSKELTLETAEGQVRQQGATLDNTRATTENTKATTSNTREITRGKKLDNDVDSELLAIDRQLGALNGGQFKALEDPAYRQTAMDLYADLQEGKGFQMPHKLFPFATQTFAEELKTGVGKPLEDGRIRESQRIVGFYEDESKPGMVAIELAVSAKGKDGKVEEYQAPVTVGRTSKETDDILWIPKAKLEERLKAVVGASLDVEQGASVEQMRRQLQARRDALAPHSSTAKRGGAGGRGGRSAQVEYLDYVTKNVFGGDSQKAFSAIKNVGPEAVRAAIIKKLSGMQPVDDLGNKTTLTAEQITTIADNAVKAMSANPDAAADAADTSASQYEMGKVYVDAQGNRATWNGSEFVESE